jgi:uncharacterized protein YkwD
MASTTTPACARLLVSACAAVLVAAFLLVASRADGAGRAWEAYLAPAAVCTGGKSGGSSSAQARAVTCLVNWARAREGVRKLVPRRSLERAAAMKSRVVAECGQLSHTPCGSDASAEVRAAGYRFAHFGENLFAGPWGKVGPRAVVTAWLRSPSHRANLLDARYRERRVRDPSLTRLQESSLPA